MSPRKQTIYLSCTTEDLGPVKEDLLAAFSDFALVEAFQTGAEASNVGVVQRCLADVDNCDVYVGLVGFRYGWVPPFDSANPDGLSITELEYRRATLKGKPRLIFLGKLDGWNAAWVDVDPDQREKMDAFRALIETDPDLSYEEFSLADKARLPLRIVERLHTAALDDPDQMPELHGDQPPYPGLYSFCYEDRYFYFGRRHEIELAMELLAGDGCQCLVVSGVSGTGKSSLVEAGILPHVRPAQLVAENAEWFLRIRPAENTDHPLYSIAYRLTDRLARKPPPDQLVAQWIENPSSFGGHMASLTQPINVIVLDQLEELFTSFRDPEVRVQFAECLGRWVEERGSRDRSAPVILASIRSDYRDQLQGIPFFRDVLEDRHYIDLFSLSSASVFQMISEPARKVGLDVSEVVEDLVASTAAEPASLPLLATTLRTLWDHRTADDSLSIETLKELGGMRGIISRQADTAYERFADGRTQAEAESAFDDLFSLLVQVSIDGAPVRRMALVSELGGGPALHLATAFASEDVRLVYFGGDAEGSRTVEVVHESIFESWQPLREWIRGRLKHERELAQARFFAKDWIGSRNQQISRLEVARIHDAHRAMKALNIGPEQLDTDTRQYLFPKAWLKDQLRRPSYEVSFDDRARIGDLLDRLDRVWDGSGDDRDGTGVDRDGIPNGGPGYWGRVEAGAIKMEISPGSFVDQTIERPFRMAKYPVTQSQFKAFVKDSDGYANVENWLDLGFAPEPHPFSEIGDNRPVVNTAWVEAMAYCKWLHRRMRERSKVPDGYVVRLPTEQEWQLASTSGAVMQLQLGEQQEWELASGAFGLMAVGLSPVANSDSRDFLDFSNYTWEWCLNQFEDYSATGYDPAVVERAVRGGSFLVSRERVRERFRGTLHMRGRDVNIGFRICIAEDLIN